MISVGQALSESPIFGLKIKPLGCIKHRKMFDSVSVANGKWSGCPRCVDEAEAAEREAQWIACGEKLRADAVQKRRDEWKQRMKRCGIPPRFENRTLENFTADTKDKRAVLDFANEYSRDFNKTPGRCAVFVGTPGTGKTHLAVAIGLEIMRQERSVLFCTTIRALRRIKDTWSSGAKETESEAVESLVWPDLLILDEVGVQFGSEAERVILFDVMNERYEQRKSTIILSNLSKEEVSAYLGERVFDRLREDDGRVLVFKWPSHRKQEA